MLFDFCLSNPKDFVFVENFFIFEFFKVILKNDIESKYLWIWDIYMETGIVKFFNPKKGYGFIATSDPDRDVFLHKTGIPFGILVNTGDKVAFETVQGPKGPNAKIIRVIDGVSSR